MPPVPSKRSSPPDQQPAWSAPSFLYGPRGSHGRSDLHDLAGAIQSSQNGPHLLPPPSARPKAIKPMTTATRRNMAHRLPLPVSYGFGLGHFKQAGSRVPFEKSHSTMGQH